MTDLSLPLCRASDPITSFEAADRVHEFQWNHHALILDVLHNRYPDALGAEQIADLTGLDAYQTRKRLPELAKQGLVMVYTETRLTATGRRERLWGAI